MCGGSDNLLNSRLHTAYQLYSYTVEARAAGVQCLREHPEMFIEGTVNRLCCQFFLKGRLIFYH